MNTLIAVFGVVLSAVVSYAIATYGYSRQRIFDVKKDALLSSLVFLDDYLSWLDFSVPGRKELIAPERRAMSSLGMTVAARECYNKLCVTCDNEKLINVFLDIIFNTSDKSICEKYNDYRQCVRRELKLKKIQFNTDRVFLSVVSSTALANFTSEGDAVNDFDCIPPYPGADDSLG